MISNATLARRTKWAGTKETTLQAELISHTITISEAFFCFYSL